MISKYGQFGKRICQDRGGNHEPCAHVESHAHSRTHRLPMGRSHAAQCGMSPVSGVSLSVKRGGQESPARGEAFCSSCVSCGDSQPIMPALARPPGRARGSRTMKSNTSTAENVPASSSCSLSSLIRRHTYGETNVAAQILAWALSAAAVSDCARMQIDPTASDSLPG